MVYVTAGPNGSDMLCLHVGLTTKGLTAAQVAPPIERCAQMLNSWIEAIRSENPDTIILCHGGPIAEPQDFSYIMRHVEGISGFYGASSIERIPVERALVDATSRFRTLHIAPRPDAV